MLWTCCRHTIVVTASLSVYDQLQVHSCVVKHIGVCVRRICVMRHTNLNAMIDDTVSLMQNISMQAIDFVWTILLYMYIYICLLLHGHLA